MLASFNAFLVAQLGPLGPIMAMGGVGLILLLIAVPLLLSHKPDRMEKLREERVNANKHVSEDPNQQLRHAGGMDQLDRFADYLEPQNEEEFSAIREQLIQAGYRSKSAVRTFYFAQFALGIGLLTLGVIYTLLTGDDEQTSTKAALTTLVPGLVGYYLPRYWVTKRIDTRQQEIQDGFPDSLDLMLVCVEAGQGLDQAIIRVSDEIRPSFPALSEEFEMVAWEIKAGKDKATVLKDMGDRSGVADVASFVTVLIQSQTFGTSIAEALRVYANEMRDKRVMRAEEKANVLPTKLTLGTMMFTLPPLLIILIGPSMYSIYETLSGGGIGVR
jgi:tight adherence protein C